MQQCKFYALTRMARK